MKIEIFINAVILSCFTCLVLFISPLRFGPMPLWQVLVELIVLGASIVYIIDTIRALAVRPIRCKTLAFGVIVLLLMSQGEVSGQRLLTLLCVVSSVSAGLVTPQLRNSVIGRPLLPISIIALVAALLRFYGIDFGLPGPYHADELTSISVINRMIQHDSLNPKFFNHPTLPMYLVVFTVKALALTGIRLSADPDLVLVGRLWSAILSVLSVIVFHFAVSRMYNARIASIASFIFAASPLAVFSARYYKEDTFLLFFIVCSVYCIARYLERKSTIPLLCAAAAVGLAASCKYSGILFIVPVVGAALLTEGITKRNMVCIAGIFFVGGLFFLIGSPYAIVEHSEVLRGFLAQRKLMQRGHGGIPIDPWSQYWMYHYTKSIFSGIDPVAAILAAVGVGVLLRSGQKPSFLIVLYCLLVYVPAEFGLSKPAPQPERYMLCIIPFLGVALAILSETAARSALLKNSVLFVALIFPFVRSIALSSEVVPDTRDILRAWMLEHLPRGAKIAVVNKRYNPHFVPSEFLLKNVPYKAKQIAGSGADYLIVSSLTSDRFEERIFDVPPPSIAKKREEISKLLKNYTLLKEVEPRFGRFGFNNPRVSLYALK